MLDKDYHDILKDMNPSLYNAVRQLVESGQSPHAIVNRIERIAGKNSVLPGLVEGTAKTIVAERNAS